MSQCVPSKVTVLVTGATGFIGIHLIKRLVLQASSFRVLAFLRETSSRSSIPSDVVVVVGDLKNKDTLDDIFKSNPIDIVIHLAAEMDFFPNNPGLLYQVNCDGTRNLILSAVDHHVKRFIYISTTEAIGPSPNTSIPADELSPTNPVQEYGKTKAETEAIVRQISGKTGLKYVILRPTGVFGPGDRFACYELIKSVEWGLLFFIPGSGTPKLMFTHVDDVVEGILCCLSCDDEALNDTYIICPDQPLTIKAWLDVLSRELGRMKPFFHIPIPVLEVGMVLLSPLLNIGKKKKFLFEKETMRRMKEERWYSNAKAKLKLGFRPKWSIEAGLIETIQFEFSHGSVRKPPISLFATISLFLFLLSLFFIIFNTAL